MNDPPRFLRTDEPKGPAFWARVEDVEVKLNTARRLAGAVEAYLAVRGRSRTRDEENQAKKEMSMALAELRKAVGYDE